MWRWTSRRTDRLARRVGSIAARAALGLAALTAFLGQAAAGAAGAIPVELPAVRPAAAAASQPRPAPPVPGTALPPADAAAIAAAMAERQPGTGDGPSEVLFDLVLNGATQPETVRVLLMGTTVGLAVDDWAALHLKTPSGAPIGVGPNRYIPLSSLAGVRWRIDVEQQALVIDIPAAAFAGVQLGLDGTTPLAVPVVGWGGFANYDVAWQRSVGAVSSSKSVTSALVEFGAFGPGGSGRATALFSDNPAQPRAVRLDTTWTVDRPETLDSLRFGDNIGRAGAWGRAARFGGVQWTTDFSTQPGFLSFPLPAMRGEAALPSTVDVYVNNTRRLTRQLPAGPFELNDLPIVTGSGQVRVVVRDLLGREQVITQPYYASPSLLRAGLRAFSYELGAVRDDYGISSNHYGRLFAAATERVGVSDDFTRELRAELLGKQGAAGATGMWQLGPIGTASLSAVGSHAPTGNGGSFGGSFEHQTASWSASMQLRGSTRRFSQVGQSGEGPTRLQTTVALGTVIANASVGVSYVQQRPWDGMAQRLVSMTATRSVSATASVGVFVLRDLANKATTAAINFNMTLGDRSSLGATTTRNRSPDQRATTTSLQLQHNLPDGPGVRYNINAEQGQGQRATAQGDWVTDKASFSGGLAQSRSNGNTHTDVRAGASGGIAWLADSVFLGRRVEGAFAVVEVDDYPDVQILHDHHPVARTDINGRALIPALRGYEPNRIGIDVGDLPFDAEVDAFEVDLVPPARSGVLMRIPVRRVRSANVRLVDAAGQPVPVGSTLQVLGREKTFPVGFDGRSFVSGLGAKTIVSVTWPDGECASTIVLPPDADEMPQLGTLICR